MLQADNKKKVIVDIVIVNSRYGDNNYCGIRTVTVCCRESNYLATIVFYYHCVTAA